MGTPRATYGDPSFQKQQFRISNGLTVHEIQGSLFNANFEWKRFRFRRNGSA